MNKFESSPENRRLVAVMFIDIVGYSAHMSKNESHALECIKKFETVIQSNIPDSGGSLLKFMGDGAMLEFLTALNAVNYAQKILAEIGDCFEVRIGIHLGDVVDKRGDLFGDTVNIASRIQALADPGGIALSDVVYKQVKNKLSLHGTHIAPVKLKNIPDSVRIFLLAPNKVSYTMWFLQKHKPRFATVKMVTFLLILLAGGWQLSHKINKQGMTDKLALLYVKTQDGDVNNKMSQEFEWEINQKLSSIPGIDWIDRLAMLEFFSKVGVNDLTKIEKLEANACRAAIKGGLAYSLACRLISLDKNHWKLDSRIICTKTGSVVGSFSTEGISTKYIVDKLRNQIEDWVAKNL